MRFVGIDIARRTHFVAVVDDSLSVLVKATPIAEDAAGYEKLLGLLGSPADVLLILEAMHMQSPYSMGLQQQVVILLGRHGDIALGLRLITMNPILLRDERKEKGKSLREHILRSRPCGTT